MARDVNILKNADSVFYTHISLLADRYGEVEPFEMFFEELRETLKQKYKSLWDCDKYEYENLIFLENYQVEIAISEYSGVISISIRHKDTPLYNQKLMNSIKKTLLEFLKDISIMRFGSFSNGEAVYRRNNTTYTSKAECF